jgi:hypothetical protein
MEYKCDSCNYKTNNKTDYAKHTKTKKHEQMCGFCQPLIDCGVYKDGNEMDKLKARVKYLESRLRALGQSV